MSQYHTSECFISDRECSLIICFKEEKRNMDNAHYYFQAAQTLIKYKKLIKINKKL